MTGSSDVACPLESLYFYYTNSQKLLYIISEIQFFHLKLIKTCEFRMKFFFYFRFQLVITNLNKEQFLTHGLERFGIYRRNMYLHKSLPLLYIIGDYNC